MPKPPYFARLLDVDSLATARQEASRIQVDKGGIPIMTYKGVMRLILIEQIPTSAANCIKQEILARGGDLMTPWTAAGFDASHVDCILIANLTTYRSLISKLFRQSVFDMPVIADVIQTLLVHTVPDFLPVSPRAGRQGLVVEETLEDLMGGRIPLAPGSHRAVGHPLLMAADGTRLRFGEKTLVSGRVAFGPQSIDQIEALVKVGAGAIVLTPPSLSMSGDDVDTDPLDALVAQIKALWGQDLLVVVQAPIHRAGFPCLVTPGPIADWSFPDLCRWFHHGIAAAVETGIPEDQILIDPGLGVGTTRAQDLEIIRRLRDLTSFGRPIHVDLTPLGSIGEQLAALCIAIANGADIIRVDDLQQALSAARFTDALVRDTPATGV